MRLADVDRSPYHETTKVTRAKRQHAKTSKTHAVGASLHALTRSSHTAPLSIDARNLKNPTNLRDLTNLKNTTNLKFEKSACKNLKYSST